MHRRSVLVVLLTVLGLVAYSGTAYASALPTGERSSHAGTLEPVYDAAHAGRIGFILTPANAPMHAPPVAWAPIYVPVYPVGTTAATTFSCMHVPVENCPSHGDAVAGAAAAIMPSVYGNGVIGHDHVLDFPSGDDFHFAWEPVLVLFTSHAAANQHLLTDTAILAARDAGQVILVPVASLTFNCAVVSSALWDRATPVV
jgi:hypothetical protein